MISYMEHVSIGTIIFAENFLFMRLLLYILFFASSFALQAQSATELDTRNGFKDIKLLSNVNDISSLEFASNNKDEENQAYYKPKSGQYTSIGAVPIKSLRVLTYDNLVYEIEITCAKDPQLFRGLEKAFGKAKHSVKDNLYHWSTGKVSLTFGSVGKKKVQLVYYAYGIKAIMKADANQKIEDLSTEF